MLFLYVKNEQSISLRIFFSDDVISLITLELANGCKETEVRYNKVTTFIITCTLKRFTWKLDPVGVETHAITRTILQIVRVLLYATLCSCPDHTRVTTTRTGIMF